jgi:hypothetical protein
LRGPSTSSTASTWRGLGESFVAAAGSIQLSGAAQAKGVDAVVFRELRDDVKPSVPVLRLTVREQHRGTTAGLGQVQAPVIGSLVAVGGSPPHRGVMPR